MSNIFRLHTYLQEQSTVSVREAQRRVRAAIHQKDIDRGGVDGLPPGDCYPFSHVRAAPASDRSPTEEVRRP
jgi:hypothetical protein